MKFVHIGDVHLDASFSTIQNRADFGQERRLEQRQGLRQVIDFIKENKVDCLLISGDFYEEQYIRQSTIEYANNLFKEIEDTKVLITPGNHDPFIKNSYYEVYDWNNNVKIFTDKVEVIHIDDVDIYGYGFDNFEMNKNQLEEIQIEDKEKTNILLTHGTLLEANKVDGVYNPISINKLKEKQFDYIAIGHVHKRDDYYPGSLISLGFDEPGKHGFDYIEINNKKIIKKEFIKINQKEFVKKELNISELNSEEELIETINSIKTDNNYYEIVLTGYRAFEINIKLKLIQKNIIKIKDDTKIKVEMQQNDKTLKGIFVKKTKKLLTNEEISESDYENILEIAKNILEK